MKAVLFVLMLGGAPIMEYDTAFECNQKALQLASDSSDPRIACEALDEDGNIIVNDSEGPAHMVFGYRPQKEHVFVIERR